MEKYEFVKDIATGNFAVKLMRNKETKELVAVKYIDRGPQINNRVAREIINHCSLSHPNIITFREVVLTPTHLAIVMDYASGGDLFDVVQNAERLSEDEARYFFQQIISGVSYCHLMQICHRDLKLENILIERNSLSPRLKICDFGFSKCLLYSRARSTVGSPGYFPPEVFSQQDYDGKLADVWSCGVIMYAMVVGELPFQDECDEHNIKEMLNRITNVRYEIPNYVHVSEDFRHLVSRIFVLDPSRRITMEEIKKHPWFLKKLPREIMEEDERRSERGATTSSCVQREEDVLKIV